MRFVICYDVPNDARRTKLASCLDGYGDRVQYSIFEAVLDDAVLNDMIRDLHLLLEPGEDRLTIYRLCAACDGATKRLGAQGEVPGTETIFLV
jgi:CRISPR-associated protein Cas2